MLRYLCDFYIKNNSNAVGGIFDSNLRTLKSDNDAIKSSNSLVAVDACGTAEFEWITFWITAWSPVKVNEFDFD